jgi:adenine-specific DNA-methyltransferase
LPFLVGETLTSFFPQQDMPRKKKIEQYEHKDKTRVNNPEVGLVDAALEPPEQKKSYAYDPHLDPSLQWAGKAERTSFEVPSVSLHVHERIDPRTIIEAVRRKNGNGAQMSLFSAREMNPPLREAIEFYKHRHNWTNRLIAGDSLLVMNSLIEKETLAGQVQMFYFDPPYGIKYGSNFQPFVNKRDVKDGKDEDLTSEPEMLRAFRDTWELGIHSYLTYLRDRLLLMRELLHESGSIFVQISDENVHHVREIMDEVFGAENFVSQVVFKKTTTASSQTLSGVYDLLLWYAKHNKHVKYRPLFGRKEAGEAGASQYTWAELAGGERKNLGNIESIKDFATGRKTFCSRQHHKPAPGSRR